MGKKRVIKKGANSSDGENRSSPRSSEAKGGNRRLARGVAHIEATYNNTLITISDEHGNALGWSSAGSIGFSGSKKATPFAAARVAEAAVEKVRKTGMQEIAVLVRGVGSGRDSAVRALANQGLNIISIRDITPVAHNGPRPKKVRRV
ncbi:MAG: 30S ribosomal protein S11 [Candidatus Sungbacteria bacterium]|nr:30S ribosomal protein S11 [Candidatus Sungbacteria bacterium]